MDDHRHVTPPATLNARIARTTATISSKLNDSNGSFSWKIHTDISPEPIELLIDSGAQISILASDTLGPNVKLRKPIFRISGVTEGDTPTYTKGAAIATFYTNDASSWITEIHIVDRRCTGEYDGLLGLDFLRKYNAILDFASGTLTLQIDDDSPIGRVLSGGVTAATSSNARNNKTEQPNTQTQPKPTIPSVASSVNAHTCTSTNSEPDQLASNTSHQTRANASDGRISKITQTSADSSRG